MVVKDSDYLLALSPLDGRYFRDTSNLREYFSEASLIKNRILVEVIYLVELAEFLDDKGLTKSEEKKLMQWVEELGEKDFSEVKEIEDDVKHDVKAAEQYIRLSLKKLGLQKLDPWVHWGLTSEDVNNLAYGLMAQKAKDEELIPEIVQLIKVLLGVAEKCVDVVMPARTHGQVAVPTTFGKELVVFASRAEYFLKQIMSLKLGGKLNGAVGNYNAQVKIYPRKKWMEFSERFVGKLGLGPVLITTQIEPGVRLVYLLDLMRQVNNVWLDMARDFWLYISYDYLIQKVVKREVGSSTMPHKVNPVNFENAEGNLELANSLLMTMSNKFPVSRMQRDLSDSTVKRNLGVAFGHSLVAVKSLKKGLKGIKPNVSFMKQEVEKHPEMMTEALQLLLKVKKRKNAYEKVKLGSRGKRVLWEELVEKVGDNELDGIRDWRVDEYIGLAKELTEKEVRRIRKSLNIK